LREKGSTEGDLEPAFSSVVSFPIIMTVAYAVVVEREEDGRYSVYVPDLPGCASMGDTYEEAINNCSRPARSA
jgi:hypothetical protein